MLENTILVFIPDSLEKSNVGFLYGFVINIEFQSEFYIIRDKLQIDPTNCIGYCGMSTNFSKYNWLHMNYYDGTLKINEISCENNQDYNLIFIIYDYSSFKKSELLHLSSRTYGNHFNNLSRALKCDSVKNNTEEKPNTLRTIYRISVNQILNLLLLITNLTLGIIEPCFTVFNMSNSLSLINSTFTTIKFALESIIKEQAINLKVGNILMTKMVDILFGFSIIYCITSSEINFNNMFISYAKELIHDLETLLNFLMGSPVGLKLNYAFNSTLGHFFLYHIALWRTFLIVMVPFVSNIFTFICILAKFGFSFQTALIADVFAFSTFHVYCIYVYAARLYGVQIRGLMSLWKLFIGRKYNPLRNRVDSCQYSHHQLFIGTLTFTILLFLLPTTMLYYVVFTILRIILIICDELLKWLRYTILTLPLYVTFLWTINSPRTKGSVHIKVLDQKRHSGTLMLTATLNTEKWWRCISGTRPQHVELPQKSNRSFRSLLQSIAFGELL